MENNAENRHKRGQEKYAGGVGVAGSNPAAPTIILLLPPPGGFRRTRTNINFKMPDRPHPFLQLIFVLSLGWALSFPNTGLADTCEAEKDPFPDPSTDVG